MEAITGETNLAKTECGHSFHFQCLIQWSQKHNTCPMCRQEFIKKEPEVPWDHRFDGESDIHYIRRITGEPTEKIQQALRYYRGDVRKTLDVMEIDDQRHLIVPAPSIATDDEEFEHKRHTRYWIPPPKNRIRPGNYIGNEYIYQIRSGNLNVRRVNLSKVRYELGIKGDPLEAGYRSS